MNAKIAYFTLICFICLTHEIKCIKLKEQPPLSKISIKDKWFVDQDNRVVLFHGINSVQKNFPWFDRNIENLTRLSDLKQWGMNVVRLGLMWSGLYPEKGVVNQSYVNEMVKIVNTFAKYGLYVIIDLHQDFLSTQFSSYDGAPLWILEQLPPPKHKYPWPFKKDNLGFGSYITESCGFAFQCLYDNINHFEDYFQDYWTTVAQIFNSTSSILGYELINEPWAGDVYKDPFLLLPGIADKQNLLPFYDRAYKKIRQYDKKTIIFYEPVTWGTMSNTTTFGTGFDHAPGHDPATTSLSWHYYCWVLNFDPNPIQNDTYPQFFRQVCDSWQLNLYFEIVEADLTRLGGGVSFLTEFGVCIFYDPISKKINLDECKATMDAADRYLVSWTYWDSNFYNDHSEIVYDIVNAFSRVYPTATNGVPLVLYYNSTTRFFSYSFNLNATTVNQASLATEIFVPMHLYPNGFNVTVSSNLNWFFDQDSSKLIVNLKTELLEILGRTGILGSFSTVSSVIVQSV